MQYDNPPLRFEDQADLLLSCGLLADRALLVSRLRAVNYYRLSGYLHPYRLSDDTFRPGTTLEAVWHHYTFDRQLRLIVMDALERVEVGVRSQLACHFARVCGPFGYSDPVNLPTLDTGTHQQWLDELRMEVERSREPFVQHFRQKYGDRHSSLPAWMLVEVMSFGKVLTFFHGVPAEIQRKVAHEYRLPDRVLWSWLLTLNTVRNICAHHGRLWNRELGNKPMLPHPRKYPEWHEPVRIPQNRVFVILTILRYLLRFVAPTSQWKDRLHSLLEDNSDISKSVMGFPHDWTDSPLWK